MVKMLKKDYFSSPFYATVFYSASFLLTHPKFLPFAEGTDTPSTSIEEAKRLRNESSEGTRKTSTINNNIAMAEEISTEAIWFGFNEEVTIATRHETPQARRQALSR